MRLFWRTVANVRQYAILSDTKMRENIMQSQRISVRVSAKTMRQLRERSRSAGMRESEVVRQALEEHLSKNHQERTAYDLFLEAGLIGCASGAPRDLATNKRYFRGFSKGK